jgi:hypothetical protein
VLKEGLEMGRVVEVFGDSRSQERVVSMYCLWAGLWLRIFSLDVGRR